MPTNRMAELQLRGRAGTLQGRVYWPGWGVARRPARLLVFCSVTDCSVADGTVADGTVADGGGWCQELSAVGGLVVLAVTAGRPAPADLEDAITAAEWAAENAARLDADSGQLLIGGIGPGGALAAAVAMHAHTRGWPVFGRQVLVCASPVQAVLASPAAASLAGVAPATVVTVEHDPGGDEGRYAALLRRAGVPVKELRYTASDPASAVRVRNGPRLLAELGADLAAADLAAADLAAADLAENEGESDA